MRPVLLTLFLAALALGCTPRLPEAPAAYPGFDTWRYPGAEALRTWREASPYRWIGYDLPAPCHRDPSWAGRRAEIEGMGWGIAVLYVGQQTFDGVQDPEEPPDVILCSRTLLTTEQGRTDGADAVAKMAAEGFPAGSTIFLNVERMEETLPAPMAAYARAWTETVLQDGRFVPGLYAHVRNAEPLHTLLRDVYRASGREDTPPLWVAGGSGFTLDARPVAVGLRDAQIWQGVLDVQRTWGEVTLSIDENVAARPYPSAPR
jgi:hypothetical protein